jgi:Haem-binding domain
MIYLISGVNNMPLNRSRALYLAAGIIILIFLLSQLIPYGRNHSNPSVVSEPKWDNAQIRALAKKACFDCHSNETIWPWYSVIAPSSWLVYRDVVEGRQRMNFSDWQNYFLKDTGDLSSVISEGEMPPIQYRLIHKTARLTGVEKSQLIDGFLKTIGQ